MAKQKVGLHKQVSEIFDGVPIPKEDGPNELAKTPLSNRLDFLRPKPRVSTPASVPARWDAGADTKNLRPPTGPVTPPLARLRRGLNNLRLPS